MSKKKTTDGWIPWALRRTNPDIFYFKREDCTPNNSLPVLIYRSVLPNSYDCNKDWLISKFTENKWTDSNTKPLKNYAHYYTNAHKALGICLGSASIHLGGTFGITTIIEKGDVVVIPVGVAFQCLSATSDFMGVSTYSGEHPPNLQKCDLGGPPGGRNLIQPTRIPEMDPILGPEEGLLKIWNSLSSF